MIQKLDHDNIVKFEESFCDENANTLVMIIEYCPYGDLQRQFDIFNTKKVHIPETYLLNCLIQIAKGLNYAHDRDICHADMKPENIFVTESGELKLGDLGLSKVLVSTAGQITSK